MEEFDELLAEAKKRGMYIVMDLVVNHCSDQHEWFKKALADPDGEYADYFYFVKEKTAGSRAITARILAEMRGSRCRERTNITCTCSQKSSQI